MKALLAAHRPLGDSRGEVHWLVAGLAWLAFLCAMLQLAGSYADGRLNRYVILNSDVSGFRTRKP